MNKKEKTIALLGVITKHKAPISLKSILVELDIKITERTLRRWLSKVVAKGLVVKIEKKNIPHYQLVKFSEFTFSDQSHEAIVYVNQPTFERRPVTYNKEWLDSYTPNQSFYLEPNIIETLDHYTQLFSIEAPAGTFARKILNRLLIDLSYNSSRLEGNTYSLLETEQLIFKGKIAEEKLDQERIMILNHKEAIRHLVDAATGQKLFINFNEICTLHYLLSDGLIQNEYAGKLRDHSVGISSSTYNPLEAKTEIETQLKLVLKKADQIKNPFEQSFFLLVHLAYLQAFADVNKRTSRLSANIPLVINNLVPFSFIDVPKDDYISALIAIYELNDINPLKDIYLFSYKRACLAYKETTKTIEFDEIRVRYRHHRREIIREIITQKLISQTLKNYVDSEIEKIIPQRDRKRFKEIVGEDLTEISESRIAGMGISIEQLNDWMKLRRSKLK